MLAKSGGEPATLGALVESARDVAADVARVRGPIRRRLVRFNALMALLWLSIAAGLACFGVFQDQYTVAWTVGFVVGAVSGLSFRLVMLVRNSRHPDKLLDPKQRQGLAVAGTMLTPQVWRNFVILGAVVLVVLAFGAPPLACFAVSFMAGPNLFNVLVYWRFDEWFGTAPATQGVYNWYLTHAAHPLVSGSHGNTH
jgi:hypothetical protein